MIRFIIVDYKSGPHLARLVTSLCQQSDPDFEAVILDNACPEGAARALDLPDVRFTRLTSPENLGFAGGCNLAAKGATTPWIALLNPDLQLSPDWLAQLKIGIAVHPQAQVFGTTLVQADAPDHIDGFGDVLSVWGVAWPGGQGQPVSDVPTSDRSVFSPCGAGAVYARSLFEALGGFDARFFCYCEDVDLGWRARLSGAQVVQLRDARARHVRSVATADNPDFRTYHSARNLMWSYAKSAPLWALPGLLLRTVLATLWFSLRGSYGAGLGARWRGLWHGLCGWPHMMKGRARSPYRRSAYRLLSRRPAELRTTAQRSWPVQTEIDAAD